MGFKRPVVVLTAFGALGPLLVACGNTQFGNAQTKPSKLVVAPSATPSGSQTGGDGDSGAKPTNDDKKQASALKPWEFSIGSVAQSAVREDVFEYLFLVDDSVSMKPHIAKLQASLGGFISAMNAEKVKFRARLLPFSALVQQLQKGEVKADNGASTLRYFRPGGVDAGLAQGSLMPNYDRGSLSALYEQSVVLANDSSPEQVASGLASALKGSTELENEPGVCLAMDFLSWQKALGKSVGKQLHVIALSTEDNSRQFDVFARNTASSTPVSSDALFCAGLPGVAKACTNPKSVWKKAKPDTIEHRYEVSYLSNSCGVGSTVPIVDLKEKKTCRLSEARFKCEEPGSTVYTCRTPSNFVSSITNKNLASLGTQRCKAAAKFECEVYVDNFPTKVVFDRATALARMKENIACVALPEAGGAADVVADFSSSEVASAESRAGLGIRSCEVYSCTTSTQMKWTYGLTETQKADAKYSNCQADSPRITDKSPWSQSNGTWSKAACSSFGAGYQAVDKTSTLVSNACNPVTPVDADIERVAKGNAADSTKTRTLGGYASPLASGQEASLLRTRFESEVSNRANNVYSSWRALTSVTTPGGYEWREEAMGAPSPGSGWTLDRVEPCAGLSTKDTGLLAPTPENFLALAKGPLSAQQITWHAIVSRDNTTCAGAEGFQSEGKDYIALAKATGGIVQNVCEPEFGTFIDKLARFSLQVPALRYPLPAEYAAVPASSLRVSLGDGALADKHYAVVEGALVFTSGAVKVGDAIRVELKGPAAASSEKE